MKTDSQLQQEITAELKWEPSVHAARIGVEVKNGVVTLAGQVDSHSEKWSAESAALRVYGVKALATELKVQLPGPSQRSDADIAAAVQNVLDWTASLPIDAVKAKVENGWVTLSGRVDWMYQRRAASDSVRHLMGVTGVSDQIELHPGVAGAVVKADIEAALKRSAMADAQKIFVTADGNRVTLSGTVQSFAEREAATAAAWATPGVRHVVDQMQLAW